MEPERIVRRCDECGKLYEERKGVHFELVDLRDTTSFGGASEHLIERKPMLLCPSCAREIRVRSTRL